MILFLIPIVIFAFSVIVLTAISHGQIHKNILFLKTINLIHIVAVCLFYVFIVLVLPFFGGRDELGISILIYALFGVATLVSNFVLLLINRLSKEE